MNKDRLLADAQWHCIKSQAIINNLTLVPGMERLVSEMCRVWHKLFWGGEPLCCERKGEGWIAVPRH